MLARTRSSPSFTPTVDPYSDDLPSVTQLPHLSRQPHFHRLDTSPSFCSPFQPPLGHSPPTAAMSCAASYRSTQPFGCAAAALPQQAGCGLSLLRSSCSVDSLAHTAGIALYKQPPACIASPALALHSQQRGVRERQQLEERKEAESQQLQEYEHKEQQHQQQQRRIRDVTRTRVPREWRRQRSKD